MTVAVPQDWLGASFPEVYTVVFTATVIFGILLSIHVAEVSSWYSRLDPAKKTFFVVASFLLYTYGHYLGVFTFGRHLLLEAVLCASAHAPGPASNRPR